MQGATDTWADILVPYGLEGGQGVGKYPEPVVLCERGESRLGGNQIRSHDGAGFLRTNRIYVENCAGGYMYHRRTQTGLANDVGSVRIDLAF